MKKIIVRKFYPQANFSTYRYFFKKSGYLYKQRRSFVNGKPAKQQIIKSKRIPGGWVSGYFYVLNKRGDLMEVMMADSF
jgi:hypothetical protein